MARPVRSHSRLHRCSSNRLVSVRFSPVRLTNWWAYTTWPGEKTGKIIKTSPFSVKMTHNELQVRGLLLNVPDVRCHRASQCEMLLTTLYEHKICCPCSSVHATMLIYIVYILWKVLQCSRLIHLQYQLLFSIKYKKTHATN